MVNGMCLSFLPHSIIPPSKVVGYHHLSEPKTALAESLYRGGLVPVSSLLGVEAP